MSEVFRVVKLAAGIEIKAYKKFSGEIGAEMGKAEYINALVEEIGSPFSIFTKKQLTEKLLVAADKVQEKMQKATSAVAGSKVRSSHDL